jgi:hypothetical protein
MRPIGPTYTFVSRPFLMYSPTDAVASGIVDAEHPLEELSARRPDLPRGNYRSRRWD